MSDEEAWDTYDLELIPDPRYKEELKDIKIDVVTWKTYILQALRQLHGVFGSAIDVDIIRNDDKRATVQVQKEDSKTFTSAITAFITDLSIFGYQHVNGHISYRKTEG